MWISEAFAMTEFSTPEKRPINYNKQEDYDRHGRERKPRDKQIV